MGRDSGKNIFLAGDIVRVLDLIKKKNLNISYSKIVRSALRESNLLDLTDLTIRKKMEELESELPSRYSHYIGILRPFIIKWFCKTNGDGQDIIKQSILDLMKEMDQYNDDGYES